MTPGELAQKCADAIGADRKSITLVLQREAKGERVRLFGRDGGPLGEVLCVNSRGETVAAFDPINVLAFLAAKRLVEVQAKVPGR